jgi:triosephosphate isomerase
MDDSRKSMADDPNDVMGIVILIRKVLTEMFHSDVAEKVRVIYGGSVNTKNVDDFLNLDILDGFLVGSASISMFDFLPIIRKVYEKQS